jgi:hypothetical protein
MIFLMIFFFFEKWELKKMESIYNLAIIANYKQKKIHSKLQQKRIPLT